MSLTLVEAAKQAADGGATLQSAIIEIYARNSDILAALPFENIAGNALRYNREDILPGVGFRGINEGYTESTGVLNPLVEPLAIAGGDVDVDNFIIATMGEGQLGTQVEMKTKALVHRWTEAFIKGDSVADPREFDGLQTRLVGNQSMVAGTTSGGDALSLAKLDELIDLVRNPTHLIMNKTMKRRLAAAARLTTVGGFINFELGAFGRRVMQYNDLPILVADEDNEGNQILPFTEAAPTGGQAQTCSIYCVSLMDGMLTGIQSAPMDVRPLGELQSGTPARRTRIEWYSGFAVFHGKAAARLRDITNAAIVA